MTQRTFLAYMTKPSGGTGRHKAVVARLHATLQQLEKAMTLVPTGEQKDSLDEAHAIMCGVLEHYAKPLVEEELDHEQAT